MTAHNQLSTSFEPTTDFQDILAGIGADFQPMLVPLQAVTMPNGPMEPVFHAVPGNFGVVNGHTGELIRRKNRAVVVGSKYNPVPYRELEVWFDALTSNAPIASFEAGMFDNGSRFWVSAKLDISGKVQADDAMDAYITLRGGLDGNTNLDVYPHLSRQWCTNQTPAFIQRAKSKGRYLSVRHTSAAISKMQLGAQAVTAAYLDIQDTVKLCDQLAASPCSLADFEDFLDEVHPLPEEKARGRTMKMTLREQLRTNFLEGRGIKETGSQFTLWALLCSVTEYNEHDRRTKGPKGASPRLLLESKLDSSWDGINLRDNQRALEYVRVKAEERVA